MEWPLPIRSLNLFSGWHSSIIPRKGPSISYLETISKLQVKEESYSSICKLRINHPVSSPLSQTSLPVTCCLQILTRSGVLSIRSFLIQMMFCRHWDWSLLHTAKCVPTPLSGLQFPKISLLTPLIYITVTSLYLTVSVDAYLLLSLKWHFNWASGRTEKNFWKISSPYLNGSLKMF